MKKLSISVGVGAIITFILALLFNFGLFTTWQEKLSDSLFLATRTNDQIVIIAIDDKSLFEIGRWPWDRTVHAQLLAKLKPAKPQAIGMDISFFEHSNTESDLRLAQELDKSVVLASEIQNNQLLLPIEAFSQKAQTGITNTIIDSDGITRKFLPELSTPDGKTLPSFALVLANTSLPDYLNYTQPLRINYLGEPYSFPIYSYSEVLKSNFDMTKFENKIVLIGATAEDLHDTQTVPTSNGQPMPGVEIHANAIATLQGNRFLLSEPQAVTIFTICLLAVIGSVIFSLFRIKFSFSILIVFLIAYFTYVFTSFDQGVIRNLIYPPAGLIIAFFASIILKYTYESKQKRFLRQAFSRYVSKDVVDEIVAHPEKLALGGEKRIVSVLFSDIQGFTSISETLDPETLTQKLNSYLTKMTEVVLEHNGVVDKFIGDSVMAFWGAPLENPNHALDACKAALKMKKVKVGKFTSRIGINTGEVVVGNMGSLERFDYTVLGDTVNVASRLEGLNKTYDTQIIISGSTYELVKDQVKVKELGNSTVKGKSQAVKVYELVGLTES